MAPLRPPRLLINIGIRIQCLVLLEFGIDIDRVAAYAGVTKSSIYRFRRIAIQRGYNLEESKLILLRYVKDAPRSRRPTICTIEAIAKVIKFITKLVEG